MTKARDIADFKFENIVDTGTEGTKVATGTSAQRGSTTGQWRFNTDTGFFEGRNAAGTFSTLEPTPIISSVDVTEVESASGGNQTFVITGSNFTSGAVAAFVGTSAQFNATTTTVDSATQITATAVKANFQNAQEPYKIKVSAASGLAGTSATGLINVDNAPTWTTAAGSLGTIASDATGNHFTVAATDAEGDTVSYSLQSGALQGLSLNSSTGVISGDPTNVSSNTTISFTLRATAGSKTADRAFSFILTPSIATFNYTGSNQTFTPPSGVTSFQVYMWGAGGQGGSSNGSSTRNGGDGGAGGYVAGTVSNYSAGTTFSILVGQGNNTAAGNNAIMHYGGGGAGTDNNNNQGCGGHDGGRSELSIGGGSNTPAGTRILVAGGGGGGGAFYHNGEPNNNCDGGDAGYTDGQSGNGTNTVPTGGTQSAGGTKGSGAGSSYNAPTNGSAGIGGMGRDADNNRDIGYGRPGGGGGGYYGGGGGDGGYQSSTSQGGGGGSSYYNSSYVSSFAHATGTQTTAPENSNTHYSTGIAAGGAGSNGDDRANSIAGNGKVVIVY